ncbi:MAG TPA: protein kinase [Bryobacteraceae bacterium]|jgi:serine/threonine protein kinase|nr:protein kinase [Bryobacteraceae bacterium]
MGFHVGQIFGDYSIVAVLGAGGMGRVYKVEHCLTKRIEAMKVLSAEQASDTQIKRFEREMRALARLNHPNIAALHNALHAENQLVLLMEFIEGETLERMFSAGRLPLDTGLEYIKQILLALGYAHQQGVVHRDVTPANVIITAAGEVKLTDFGLSKSYGDSLLTNCGEVLGSLPYLAPEQLKGITQPDRRSDLYSVGALLYEHLTGQKPFGAKRRLAPVITDSEGDAPPPSLMEPSLSPAWDEIIRRTLARDPAHRYQTAEEFLNAIAQLHEPADVADLPLPQLRTLGIGIALFAGLVLAMVASPEFSRFHKATPAIQPWHGIHVAPPAFAADKTPASKQIPAAPTSRLAQRAQLQPAKSADPIPVVADEPPATITPAPEVVAPPNAAVATDPVDSQDVTPPKKRFWSKLNIFKKKSAEPKDKP